MLVSPPRAYLVAYGAVYSVFRWNRTTVRESTGHYLNHSTTRCYNQGDVIVFIILTFYAFVTYNGLFAFVAYNLFPTFYAFSILRFNAVTFYAVFAFKAFRAFVSVYAFSALP